MEHAQIRVNFDEQTCGSVGWKRKGDRWKWVKQSLNVPRVTGI